MAAAYARDSGARLNHWPLYQPIQDDELFSSWLLRNALAHGCAPLVFCGALWPGVRMWTVDIDCGVGAPFLRQLDDAEFPGVVTAVGRFSRALQCVSGTESRHANRRWVLSLGLRNRQHQCGLQYCPICFEEGLSYFRYHWRFAWRTGCEKHGSCLLSRCRECHAPVQPHLLVPPVTDCSICHACGAPLGSSLHVSICPPDAIRLQSVADDTLSGADVSKQATEWFEYTYLLVSLMRYAMRSRSRSTLQMLSSLGAEITSEHQVCSGLPLELLEVSERVQLMSLLAPLVAQSPQIVAQAITDYRLPLSIFGRHISRPLTGGAAKTLVSAAIAHPHKSSCANKSHVPADRSVVEREWRRLQRKIFAYARP